MIFNSCISKAFAVYQGSYRQKVNSFFQKTLPFTLSLLLLCNNFCSAVEGIPGETAALGQEQDTVLPLTSSLLAHADSLASSKPNKNFVHVLNIGEDALLARIHLIRSAQKSIALQTIIWVNDEVGRLLMYELIQAAKRGVTVQLLIDHFASEQNLKIATFLASIHQNLQIKLYNPLSANSDSAKISPSFFEKLHALFFTFDRFNQRMHNKTFIVDDMIGITGGRNYQNAYFDQARGLNYKDRDVLVIGPVVREMKASFQAYWEFNHSVSLADLKDVRKMQKQGNFTTWETRDSFQLHGLFENIEKRACQYDLITEMFVNPLMEVEQAYFIADDPGKIDQASTGAFKGSKITLELANLVANARQSVYIQTPYLVLTSQAVALFKELGQNRPEIDIRVSTNSLAATDSWYVYALSYKQKRTYIQTLKLKIYELKPLPGDMYVFMPTFDQLRTRPFTPVEYEKARHYMAEAAAQPAERGQKVAGDSVILQRAPKPGEPYFCLHSKSMVIDDEIAFIGSYNLDPRSENLNTEVGLVIYDKRIAGLLKSEIKQDMAPQNSWVIGPKKMPMGLNHTNAIIEWFSDIFPIIDPWPIRYASAFELIEGKTPVDIDYGDFYENYKDVGSFPQASKHNSGKELGARSTKAFLSFVKPLL